MSSEDKSLVAGLREYLAKIEAERKTLEERHDSTIELLNRLTRDGTEAATPERNGKATNKQSSPQKRRPRQSAEKRMQDIEDYIRKEGGQAEQVQIRQKLDLDTGTTTRLVHRLEENGRVKIKRDGRRNFVSIARETNVKPGEGVEEGRGVAA